MVVQDPRIYFQNLVWSIEHIDWRHTALVTHRHILHGISRLPLLITLFVNYVLTSSPLNLARDLALILVVGRLLVPLEDSILKHGISGTVRRGNKAFWAHIFEHVTTLPIIRGAIQKKLNSALADIETTLIERGPQFPENHALPEQGYSPRDIQEIIRKLDLMKQSSWASGRLSGAVYHGGPQLRRLQTDVYGLYTFANQLHPDCFPAVRRMDAEVVSMVLDLFNGPSGSCGTTTSGGTESLLLTCLAAREHARVNRGLTEFEIIAPITVHAGINKAAHYFNMRLIHAPVDPKTMKVDTNAVKSLIGPNTVLLVGSAPNFPHGIIDDIETLGQIAQKNELFLHVDACLGSFIVPFLETVGGQTLGPENVPLFDFRVPGVTSISCDTHKYGFAPKGSSVIMYRSPELRRLQYFVSTDWSGGLYASPTLAGSRPGALIAGCWATMIYMGKDGYRRSAQSIISTARKFREGIEKHADLFFVYGDPQSSVVAIGSHKINIYDLNDAMSKRGWHLNALQDPPAIHLASTELTKSVVDELIRDLVETAHELEEHGSSALQSTGSKALYGVAGSVRTVGIAEKLAEGFVDFLYKP